MTHEELSEHANTLGLAGSHPTVRNAIKTIFLSPLLCRKFTV